MKGSPAFKLIRPNFPYTLIGKCIQPFNWDFSQCSTGSKNSESSESVSSCIEKQNKQTSLQHKQIRQV